jgi:hypothetical protein
MEVSTMNRSLGVAVMTFAGFIPLAAARAQPSDSRPSPPNDRRPDRGTPAWFIGVPAFTSLDRLPYLRRGVQTHQFCSYDRAGDNYDADYFPIYKETNGESVLFDAYGPGCLYRLHLNIWNGDVSGVNIRFYFDDEPQPRIDMDVTTFFSADNPLGIFRAPLAYIGPGYRLIYHPFFFSRRLKVSLSKEPLGQEPGWDKLPWLGPYDQHPYRRNHWYNFTYHTFTESPDRPSWSRPEDMSSVMALWDPAKIGLEPQPSPGALTDRIDLALPAGESLKSLELREPGTITALRLSIAPDDEAALFDTWLTICFDGSEKPQVEAPLGCMFGVYRTALDKRMASRFVGTRGPEMYCYLPTPFWKSAVVSFSNRGARPVDRIRGEIVHVPMSVAHYPESDCGYFHAIYHRESPRTEGHDYRYVSMRGRGQVVGHFNYRWDTSMEEDERTYFDDSRTPQLCGEGYEDDHNQGWGLRDLNHAIYGSVASDGGAGAVWRFYIPDMYVFQNMVRPGHQVYGPRSPRGHEGMYQVGREESVTFLYLRDEEGMVLTDELDVGNAASEASHSYRVLGSREDQQGKWWYDGEENNVLFATPAIADDGVSTDKGSSFQVKISRDNRGVRLRRRTDKANNQQLARVYIDDVLVQERPWYSVDFERTFRDIRWLDTDFEVPPRYTAGKAKITVRIEPVSSATGRWDEFRYWIFSYR